MSRKSAAPPLVVGSLDPVPESIYAPAPWSKVPRGRSAYILPSRVLSSLTAGAVTVWALGASVRALQMPGGGIWKATDGLDQVHRSSESAVLEFWREARDLTGSPMPANYSSVFHDMFHTEAAPAALDNLFAPWFAGGWEAAVIRGPSPGPAFQYDMRSAYLWASTLGLPRMASVAASRVIAGNKPGVYLVDQAPRDGLPYPFNRHAICIATDAECEAYNLEVRRVLGGATWSDCLPADAVTSVCDRASFGKQMGRAYWGRWASASALRIRQGGRWREMQNRRRNFAWAHLIVSRVRMRLWEASRAAGGRHVYVDAVISDRPLPTGDGLGDWRLIREFPAGVDVKGTGRYLDLVGNDAGTLTEG